MPKEKLSLDTKIATFCLVLMCVHMPFFEGHFISPVKVTFMSITPFICFARCAYFSKALLWGGLYWFSCFLSAYLHPGFRLSTIAYLGMFVMTFIMFYNLVYKGAFTLEYFIKLLRWLLLVYAGCLVLQQCCLLVGIRYMPLINLNNEYYISLSKLPSLSHEPSSSARILGALFYSYFKCNQYSRDSTIPFKQWFKGEHKWVTIGFLWAMLTMGSGTAYVVLALLSLLFLRRQYMVAVIPLVVILCVSLPYIDNENMNRATDVAQATMTGNAKNVMEADGSAAVRVLPLLNTINHLDVTKPETWLGMGTDTALNGGYFVKTRMVGCINDYGLICYGLSLCLIFSCCVKWNSIPSLFFVTILGAGIGNIAYAWSILMLFTVQLYFARKYK